MEGTEVQGQLHADLQQQLITQTLQFVQAEPLRIVQLQGHKRFRVRQRTVYQVAEVIAANKAVAENRGDKAALWPDLPNHAAFAAQEHTPCAGDVYPGSHAPVGDNVGRDQQTLIIVCQAYGVVAAADKGIQEHWGQLCEYCAPVTSRRKRGGEFPERLQLVLELAAQFPGEHNRVPANFHRFQIIN